MSSVRADVAQLRALLFCRSVSPPDGEGATLHGVHDVRYADEFPARWSDLLLYVSFETLRRDRTDFEVVARSPVSRHARVVHQGVAESGHSRVVTVVVDLQSTLFEAEGKYSFALYVGGLLVGTATLTVSVPTSKPSTLQ